MNRRSFFKSAVAGVAALVLPKKESTLSGDVITLHEGNSITLNASLPSPPEAVTMAIYGVYCDGTMKEMSDLPISYYREV